MKHKTSKKKIIILIVSFLVILLGLGTFKGYQSFCHDQRQTAEDMDSMMKLFNMQLRVPNKKISGIWSDEQEDQVLNDVSFDTGVFAHYLIKKATFQEIEYKDVEPQWSLSSTEKEPSTPDYLSTVECLKNLNDNLRYNPKYQQYACEVEFKPLTMDDLLNNPKKVIKIKNDLLKATEQEGFSLSRLTDACPSQYLPK